MGMPFKYVRRSPFPAGLEDHPSVRHRMKVLQTVQAPNRSGISHHWLPTRNRQIFPSNCPRSRSTYVANLPIGQRMDS